VLTFVDEGNAASLKGCARAGFVPYLRRHERFRLFWRFVSFTAVSLTPPQVDCSQYHTLEERLQCGVQNSVYRQAAQTVQTRVQQRIAGKPFRPFSFAEELPFRVAGHSYAARLQLKRVSADSARLSLISRLTVEDKGP